MTGNVLKCLLNKIQSLKIPLCPRNLKEPITHHRAGFLPSALLRSGAAWSSVVGRPGHCRMVMPGVPPHPRCNQHQVPDIAHHPGDEGAPGGESLLKDENLPWVGNRVNRRRSDSWEVITRDLKPYVYLLSPLKKLTRRLSLGLVSASQGRTGVLSYGCIPVTCGNSAFT